MKLYIISTLLICAHLASAQTNRMENATIIRFTSPHTAFPDAKRASGYTYDKNVYDAVTHYSDSSVCLVVPHNLRTKDHVDLVFWFHGWLNNIDSSMIFFHLAEQFINSNSNAVLVLAETSKDSQDSYGGKLEQQDMFKNLVTDILNKLKEEKVISKNADAGNIVLSGHSGAYRIIAYILQNGGVAIQEVDLFDALYGQVDKYLTWLQKDKSNHFVHWYTSKGGGTDEVSAAVIDTLKQMNIPFMYAEEANMNTTLLQSSRIAFVHSARAHNEVINNPDNFQLLLETSTVLKKRKK